MRMTGLTITTCAFLVPFAIACVDSEPAPAVGDTAQASADDAFEVFVSWGSFASGGGTYQDECRSLDIEFGGFEQRLLDSGDAPVTLNMTWGHVFGRNLCTGVVIDGGGSVTGAYDGDLDGASVNIDFEVIFYQWPGGSPDQPLGTIAVHLEGALTGVGEITTNRFQQQSGECPACTRQVLLREDRDADSSIASFTFDGAALTVTPRLGHVWTESYATVSP